MSSIVDKVTSDITAKIADPDLAKMFNQCFPNTLDTTVNYFTDRPDYDTFIITGDIDAMWLRDSTNQVFPYLKYANQDAHLKNMLVGLIHRQLFNVKLDTYANAYNPNATGKHCDANDKSTKLDNSGKMVNGITAWHWERKYEIDSTAAVLKLVFEYYSATGDSSVVNQDYLLAVEKILNTYQEQMRGTRDEDWINRIAYTFQRVTSQPTDSLSHTRGPFAKFTGMIKSAFRPSDDACTFPFLIPANAMASVYLNRTAQMIRSIYHAGGPESNSLATDIADRAGNMSLQIRDAIYKYGVTYDSQGNKIFAYEVDGYGGMTIMDDANVPSLLTLPLLGFVDVQDEIYQNTRKLILSDQNPYYFKGKAGQGIGGAHIGDNYIWPMSIISQIMTATSDAEITQCLNILKTTTAGTHFVHESFYKDNPSDYTRSWFAWANTYFGEMMLYLAQTKPHLIFQ